MAPIAQNAVKHDDTGGVLGSVIAHHLDADLGVDHGMRATLGIHVVAEVDNVIATMAQHVAVFLDDVAKIQGLGDHHGSLASEGTAGIQADDGLVLAKRSIDGDVERLGVVLLDGLAASKVDGDASGFLKGVCKVDLALMRLGLLADENGDDRLGALLQKIDNLIADLGRRRLGDDADDIGRVMVLECDDGVLNGDGADLLIKIAATRADCVHAALSQAVDHARNLLDAGSRSTDDTDIAGIDDISKCHRDTRNDAGAAVRSHEEQPLFMSLLLQTNLVLQGNIVRERKDIEPQVECALKLGSGILTRDGEESHVSIGKHRHGLFPARRLGGDARDFLLYRKVVQERLGLGKHRIDDAFVFGLDNDNHIAGVGSSSLIG